MNAEQERAAFEAWYQHHHGDRDVYALDDFGEYADKRVQSAFNVWQARAALQSQDREDAERYRWVKRHAHPNRGFDEWCLPYVDYVDDNLDAAIDHARRAEDKS